MSEMRRLGEAKHLLPFNDQQWALWRCVCLRGAGFPASGVLRLELPDSAAAADQVLDAEEMIELNRARALKVLNGALDGIRAKAEWSDSQERKRLVKAVRRLKAGKLPDDTGVDDASYAALCNLRAAVDKYQSAWSGFEQAFQQGMTITSQALRETLLDNRFREAMIWQNRRAFHSGISSLLADSAADHPRDSKRRQHEELVASYLQRYCLKNDTIGFFGPVGWATLSPEGRGIDLRPGPDLLARRTVYFEVWCIDELADTLSKRAELRPWLIPQALNYIRIEGLTLYLPNNRVTRVTPKTAAVLAACDGVRSAEGIADDLKRNLPGIESRAEVYSVLDDLNRKSLISWALQPPVDSHPERHLRRALERAGDNEVRRNALGAVETMEKARTRVALAAGDPDRLDQALCDLEKTFASLTGAKATRSAGEMYAGRTLVYEDCRRDVELSIGRDILESVEAPLSLLFITGRWVTYRLARLYGEEFRRVYREVAQKTGSPRVNARTFWMKVLPMFLGDELPLATGVLRDAQERWDQILSIPEGPSRIQYDCKELRPKVLAAFSAPRAGWQYGRYHSPDLLIASKSVEDIRKGKYQLILGEIHLGLNTIGSSLFMEQHPRREELIQAVDFDMPEPRLVPVHPRSWPYGSLRIRNELKSPKDYHVLLAYDSIPPPGTKAIPLSSLSFEEDEGQLELRSSDGKIRCDILEAFGEIFSGWLADKLKVFPATPHTPRTSLDRLIVSRETWRFPVSELEFAFEKDEARRFIRVRRWARAHGLPQRAFVKAPVERKPVYVDFSSPIYVSIFAKMVRRTSETAGDDSLVCLTEMLPDVEQCWLLDAEGRRYTSEFRFVGLDLTY